MADIFSVHANQHLPTTDLQPPNSEGWLQSVSQFFSERTDNQPLHLHLAKFPPTALAPWSQEGSKGVSGFTQMWINIYSSGHMFWQKRAAVVFTWPRSSLVVTSSFKYLVNLEKIIKAEVRCFGKYQEFHLSSLLEKKMYFKIIKINIVLIFTWVFRATNRK